MSTIISGMSSGDIAAIPSATMSTCMLENPTAFNDNDKLCMAVKQTVRDVITVAMYQC